MLRLLARNWWVLVLRGLAAIILGIMAIVWPDLTLLVLVTLFGVYVLVDGILALIEALATRERNSRWWAVALAGVAGIVLGVLTLAWPGITALVLLYLIAAWAIIEGLLEIVAAIQLRHEIEGEWMMVVSGLLSIVFGVLLMLFPGQGALGLVGVLGIYAIVMGILHIILAFRVRRWAKDVEKDVLSLP